MRECLKELKVRGSTKPFHNESDEVAPLHIKLEKLQNKLMPFQKEIDAAQAQVNLASNELAIFTEKSTSAQKKLEQAKKDVAELSNTIDLKKKERKQVSADIDAINASHTAAEKELGVLTYHFLCLILDRVCRVVTLISFNKLVNIVQRRIR
jgi:chromosome segregation ATPase